MKRIILSALALVLMMGNVDAQDAKALKAQQKAAAKAEKAMLKELNGYIKEAKKLSEMPDKPDFAGARAAIAKGFENPKGATSADLHFQAAQVEYACFNFERNKPATGGKMDEKIVYETTSKAYEYYSKAYELYAIPNEKGKVNDKNNETILTNAFDVYRCTGAFRANAGYYYGLKDWKAAYDYFNLSITATESKIINDHAAANPVAQQELSAYLADSTKNQTAFNRAVVAIYMEDHNLAIKELEYMKDKNYETNLIYQSLCREYLAINDSASFINLLQEGVKKMPEEPWYSTNLLNIYIDRKDYEAATKSIESIVASDPNNARYVDLKGRLLEMQGDVEGAITAYKKAVEIDPTQGSSYSNLGRVYFNKATDKENELYDQRKYDDVDKVAGPMYLEALPFYEKAFQYDTKHEDNTIANALRTIYYKEFQKPSCPNKKELIAKYNEVSVAYGLPEFKN